MASRASVGSPTCTAAPASAGGQRCSGPRSRGRRPGCRRGRRRSMARPSSTRPAVTRQRPSGASGLGLAEAVADGLERRRGPRGAVDGARRRDRTTGATPAPSSSIMPSPQRSPRSRASARTCSAERAGLVEVALVEPTKASRPWPSPGRRGRRARRRSRPSASRRLSASSARPSTKEIQARFCSAQASPRRSPSLAERGRARLAIECSASSLSPRKSWAMPMLAHAPRPRPLVAERRGTARPPRRGWPTAVASRRLLLDLAAARAATGPTPASSPSSTGQRRRASSTSARAASRSRMSASDARPGRAAAATRRLDALGRRPGAGPGCRGARPPAGLWATSARRAASSSQSSGLLGAPSAGTPSTGPSSAASSAAARSGRRCSRPAARRPRLRRSWCSTCTWRCRSGAGPGRPW